MKNELLQNHQEIMKLNKELSLIKNKNINMEETETMQNLQRERSRAVLPPLQIKYEEWEEFELITRNKGAKGPKKSEFISYYSEK